MNTAERAFEPLEDAGRYVSLLAGARSASDVVTAVRGYLAAWPTARVANLQRIDGGWAPFDADLQPTPLYRPADLQRVCDAVHGQCVALRDAGMALTPELLELDLFFLLATAKLAQLEPQPARSSVLRGSGHLA